MSSMPFYEQLLKAYKTRTNFSSLDYFNINLMYNIIKY
jgi:hypothetical protein